MDSTNKYNPEKDFPIRDQSELLDLNAMQPMLRVNVEQSPEQIRANEIHQQSTYFDIFIARQEEARRIVLNQVPPLFPNTEYDES